MVDVDLGKLFFCGFNDFNEEVKEIIRKYRPAGILIYPGVLSKEYLLMDFMSFLSKEGDFLISSDHEGGQLEVLKYVPSSPGNLAFGKNSPDVTYRYSKIAGKIMEIVGFNMVFAPVLDLLSEESSSVIDMRSYGSDPKIVAEHGAKACEGYLEGGVMPCIKHFPGHGRAREDSHLTLPVVDAPFEKLWEEDLLPFRKVLEREKKVTVMTAHVRYSSIDSLPATLSEKIITDVLRKKIGFDGLVISDAMEMSAVSNNFSVEEIVSLFLNAGGNMILLGDYRNLPVYYETLVKLLEDGKVQKDKVERSIRMVEKYLAFAKKNSGVGFLADSSAKAVEFLGFEKIDHTSEVTLLVPSSENLSQADTTGGDYDQIPEIVSRFFEVENVVRYTVEDGPEFVEGDLIFDFVADIPNEKALKAHLSLPAEKTVYFVLRNPFDVRYFEGRKIVVTRSTKPISIYKSLEHFLGRCDS